MSANDNENITALELQRMDYVASAAKAALGAVPFAGSLLVELSGTVIPNQRVNRIVSFAKTLERRLSKLEREFVQSQLNDDTFTDLLEEGLRQASRSLSEERQEYISSLISNSLSSKDIEYIESKHLLKILDEINDIEVIWLRFHLVSSMGGDKEFRENHKEILKPVSRVMSAPQAIHDKGTLQDSYKDHLARLGLLLKDGRQYALAPLGRLLLHEIGLLEEDQA